MQVNIFATPAEKIETLSNSIIDTINFLSNTRKEINIAVSGGKSPIPLFEQLSKAELNWQSIHIHLVDERVVETSSEDSNEFLIRKYFLQNNAKKAIFNSLYNQFDRIRNETQNSLGTTPANFNFDLLILGMGEDGHFASLFPDSPQINNLLNLNNKNTYEVLNTPSSPYQRISMTYATILKTPFKYLSIDGINKLNVLIEASKSQNIKLPISYLLSQAKSGSNDYPISIYWS